MHIDDFGEIGIRLAKRSPCDYASDLAAGREFSLIKLNHGFFERILRTRTRQEAALKEGRPIDPAELDRLTGRTPCFVASGFLDELLDLFSRADAMPGDLRIGFNPQGCPGSLRLRGVPRLGVKALFSIADELLPRKLVCEDGLIWKQGVIDGSIGEFFRALRQHSVVLVGPPHCGTLGDFLQLPKFCHVEIHPTDSRCEREIVLERIERELKALAGTSTVCLFEAGSLTPWLILKLHASRRQLWLIDMGTVLEISSIDRLAGRSWGQYFRGHVARTLIAINPNWPFVAHAYDEHTSPETRARFWLNYSTGIDASVAETAGLPARVNYDPELDFPDLAAPLPVAFIENKPVDFKRVEQILALSKRDNHWANFGPVTSALERALTHVWNLPPERAVVMCSSGTAALFALAGLHAYRLGRPLRWVGSAFGFLSSNRGPLAEAMTLIDCDELGRLDLAALASLPVDSYDGVLLTNTFGLQSNPASYVRFCRQHEKRLIIDNALGFSAVNRRSPNAPDEFVSFHQTKPWGVGEAGCAIVRHEDAPIVRRLLNFGVGLAPWLGRFASNGKISDFASALILDRLERLPNWQVFYAAQRARISFLAEAAGLRPLDTLRAAQILNHLPLLSSGSIEPEALKNAPFVIRKYYRPLGSGHAPRAHDIFNRIVNVPAHSGMAAVPTELAANTLRALVS